MSERGANVEVGVVNVNWIFPWVYTTSVVVDLVSESEVCESKGFALTVVEVCGVCADAVGTFDVSDSVQVCPIYQLVHGLSCQ